ncbi:MAG: hypothetical protein WB661_12970 [Candidatus Bathyarchaeia archaeon]
MLSLLVGGLSRRRAVSTIIGGMIILSLLLTALGTMVFVSQQYDQYQQTAYKMGQYRDRMQSESITANPPGLTVNAAWTGCGGCNMYNMSLSNLGGVGVQIARIYITSKGSGCTSLCVLNPSSSSSSYAFRPSAQFLNPGETNHVVLLFLPNTIALPYALPPPNTISIVTSRGSVFSFQWPFQIQIGGQSQSAFSAGIVKVAYQGTSSGYDSKNEYGPVHAVPGSGGTQTSGYCHNEPVQSYPAGASYAEKLSNVAGVTGNTLWFLSPWVTLPILTNARTDNGATYNQTRIYLYVNITNTGNTNITIAGGSIDLTWYGSDHINAVLIGFYYYYPTPQFYAAGSAQKVAVGKSLLAIFEVYFLQLGNMPTTSVMFWGSASLSSSTKDYTFVGGVALMSGLWVRLTC